MFEIADFAAFSEEQWKLAQWGLVPGSWEHQLYYEAARCLTEQRFSIMKSINLAGFEQIKWGPRREPMLVVLIALWVAATNLAIQEVHYSRSVPQGQIVKHLRDLEKDLGRAPTMTPPRT
ncbi:MAG: hypothetical protein SOW59_09800 [Corynebacterium sp.]|nr:hypothetical protein [Corynebacterium sp.]